MDDLEAARFIEQALINLPKDYPYRDEAFQAYGRLILGKLQLKPMEGFMLYGSYKGSRWYKGCKWWLIKPMEEHHENNRNS